MTSSLVQDRVETETQPDAADAGRTTGGGVDRRTVFFLGLLLAASGGVSAPVALVGRRRYF